MLARQHRKMKDADPPVSFCEDHKHLSAVDLVQVHACVALPRSFVIGQTARTIRSQPFEMTTHVFADAAQLTAKIAEFVLCERMDRYIVDRQYSKFPILLSAVGPVSRNFLYLLAHSS